MKKIFLYTFISTALFLFIVPLSSEEHGANQPSKQKADQELSELVGTSNFFVTLQNEYRSKNSPDEAIALIRKFLPIVSDGNQKYTLLMDMATLEEQQGKLQSAQLHYQSAAFATSGTPAFKALYHSVLLLVEFGDYDQALLQCRHIAIESSSADLTNRARLQESRILLHQSKFSEAHAALQELYNQRKTLSAHVLYGMYRIYVSLNNVDNSSTVRNLNSETILNEKKSVVRELYSRYPESPEYGLIENNIEPQITTETAFGFGPLLNEGFIDIDKNEDEEGSDSQKSIETEKKVGTKSEADKAEPEEAENQKSRAIQTGSFQDAENAHYMQQELEKQGFTAMVVHAEVQGQTYYRVLVPIAYGETEEEIVLQLKEKGFEGYPVY